MALPSHTMPHAIAAIGSGMFATNLTSIAFAKNSSLRYVHPSASAMAGTMKLYRQREWKAYCAEQIKLHGGVCAHCLRAAPEVVLQVHHRDYVKGRLPWEYHYDECDVLCRGCHAKEHGIIMPSKDWEFIGEDDLGGLDGECEYCGKELRYTHMVSHPNWGTMIVGEKCCDNLTESTIGTEQHAEFLNYVNRRKTFIKSPKWFVAKNGVRSIDRAGIAIAIVPTDDGRFRFNLNDVKGKADHSTLLDAQISVFDYVESGKAAEYLAERRRKIAERKASTITKPAPTFVGT
jgi:hypothetical protein